MPDPSPRAETGEAAPTKSSKGQIAAILLAPALVLSPPLVNFLKSNDYPLLLTESLICLAALVALGLGIGTLMALRGRFTRAIVFAFLGLYFADLQLSWYGLAEGTAPMVFRVVFFTTFFGTYVVAWLLHEHFASIVALAGGTILASTLIIPAVPVHVGQAAPPSTKAHDASLPPIIHLIIDEQISAEGIPIEFEGGPALKALMRETYVANGFRLFGRAYSHYLNSHNSIQNVLNFSASPINMDRIESRGRTMVYVENAYFRRAVERGYRIRVYQPDVLDYCHSRNAEVVLCRDYAAARIKTLIGERLGPDQKARVIVSRFLGLSSLHKWVWSSYMQWRAIFAGWGLFVLPPMDLESILVPSTPTLPIIEELAGEVAAAGNGYLHFLHLGLPHFPHAYDASCRLKPSVSTWTNITDRHALPPYSNTPETRRRAYENYFKQAACLHKALGRLFDELKASGVYDDAIIVIHGDHGSRIGMFPAVAGLKDRLSVTDYRDYFATSFAIKAPGVAAGYDLTTRSIQRLFAEFIFDGEAAAAGTRAETPFVYLTGGSSASMRRREIADLFGRSE